MALMVKNLLAVQGDPGSIPESEKIPGKGNGCLIQLLILAHFKLNIFASRASLVPFFLENKTKPSSWQESGGRKNDQDV